MQVTWDREKAFANQRKHGVDFADAAVALEDESALHMSEDFSKGKRGAVVRPGPAKVRITIRLDGDIIEFFKQQVLEAGGGNYQTLINQALRDQIENGQPLEDRIRKVIREELRKAG